MTISEKGHGKEMHKEPNKVKAQLSGWVCPVCGAGVSPYVQQCPNNHRSTNSANTKGIKLRALKDHEVRYSLGAEMCGTCLLNEQ